MNRLAMVLSAMSLSLLVSCASTGTGAPVSAGPSIKGDGTCHADRVAWAVGKPADEAVMKKVWSDSGSGLIRPIAPGQAVERDFRADRINVHIGAGNLITQVVCG